MPRYPIPSHFLACGKPDNDAERAEQEMIASLQNYASTCRKHQITGILKILQDPVLLVPKCRLPKRCKNIRDRFPVVVTDNRVCVDKTKSATTRDLPPDRRFSGTHEPDQDYIMDGPWEM